MTRLASQFRRLRDSNRARSAWAECVAILVVLASFVATFNRVIFLHETFWNWDISFLNIPMRRALGLALRNGRPDSLIWNPLIFGGFPLFADGEGGYLYPLNLIAYRFTNALDAHAALTVFHYTAAGLSSYVLARRLGATREGSVVAGLVYPLGGAFAGALFYSSMTASAAWLPLLLLTTDMTLRSRKIWTAALGGVVFGIQILAGHYQLAAFSFVGVALYAAGTVIGASNRVAQLRLVAASLSVTAIVGLGTTAVQLIPTLELQRETFRAGASFDFAMTGSIGLSNFLTLVYPLAFYDPVAGLSLDRYGTDTWMYAGVAPLFLAIVSLFGANRRRNFPVTFMTLAALGLSMGRYLPFYPVLHLLPFFDGLRFPSRFGFILDLGLGLLAAQGVTAIGSGRISKAAPRILGGAAIGLGLLLFAYFEDISGRLRFLDVNRVRDFAISYFGDPRAARSALSETLVATSDLGHPWVASPLLFLVLTGALLIVAGWYPRSSRIVPKLAVALTTLDLLFFASFVWPLARAPWSVASAIPLVVQAVPPEARRNRFLTSYSVTPVGDLMRPDTLLNYDIATLDGFSPLTPRRHAGFMQVLSNAVGTPRFAKLLAAANVSYTMYAPSTRDPRFVSPFAFRLMDTGSPPSPFVGADFVPVWKSGSAEITRNSLSLPRAFTVDNLRSVRSLDEAVATLSRGDFDPTAEAVVEGRPDLPFSPRTAAPSRIQWIRDDPLDVQLIVTTDHPTLLVLADLWYPAWRVQVDDVDQVIYPTDVMFRGVPVPWGSHRVHFRYDLDSIFLGGFLTLCTLVVITLWVATNKRGEDHVRIAAARGHRVRAHVVDHRGI